MVGLVVVALVGGAWWWLRPSPSAPEPSGASPSPGALATPVVRTSGGQLGRVINYSTAAGTGTVSVQRATWTSVGAAAPEPGEIYLIVDVEFTGVSGAPAAGESVLLVRDASGVGCMPAFGPGDEGVPNDVLAPGETLTGQAGFAVRPGDVTLSVVDERLLDVVTIEIPGP